MRELGYNNLQAKLSEDDFNDNLEEIRQVKIRYKDEKKSQTKDDFIDGDFLDVFQGTGITEHLKSVLVLLINLIELIKKDKSEPGFFKNLFTFGALDSDETIALLLNTESFLKRLAGFLYEPSVRKKMDDNNWTLANFIDWEQDGDRLINSQLNDLVYVLKEYTNTNRHDSTKEAKVKYIFSEDKATRKKIHNSVVALVLMVVYYHFDAIDDLLQNPDIIADKKNSSIMEDYLKKLQKDQLEILNKIYGINEINEIGLDSIAEVSLKSFSHDSNTIEQESHILLAGESGTGKSTLLAAMVYKDIVRWDNDNSSPIPVKIELQDYRKEHKDSFMGFIVNQIEKELDIRNINIHAYLRQLFKEGKIVLYVDGLNELPLSLGEYRIDAIKGLLRISRDYKDCRFIITSRIKDMGLDEEDGDGVYGQLVQGGSIGLFKRYDLQPFTKEQIGRQIESYLKAKHTVPNEKEQKKIAGYINKNKIEELAKNPLQLILILNYFDKNKDTNSLAVSNRSQLLFKLTEDITKNDRIKNRSNDKLKKINKEIRKILLKVAEHQYQKRDNQGLKLEEIELLCQNILDPSIDPVWTIEAMLEIADTFGIMEKKNNIYNFRHDSWREHFQAFNIVKQLQTSDKPVLILQDIYQATNHFKDREAQELFRHIFEIAEMVFFVEKRNTIRNILEKDEIYKENIRKEIEAAERDEEYQAYINDKARFIDEYGYSDPKKMMQLTAKENKIKRLREDYEKNAPEIEKQKEAYLCSTEDLRKLLEMLAHTLLQYDNGLKILSYATATMTSFDLDNTDTSIVPPKTIVEQTVVNRMNSYKAKHPEGDQSINNLNQELKPIFECTALSGNGKLLGDLIGDLYWLNIWLNLWTGSETLKSMENVLTGVLMAKCENQLALFYSMFDAYKKVNQLAMIKTANKVELIMMRLITLMNDGDVIEIITDFLSKNYQDPIDKIQKTRIGPKLLLGLKDIDLMFKILNEREELQNYRFETTIHLRTLDNLLRYFSDQRMQQFLIGSQEKEGLISTLRQGDEDHLLLLNYTFHRIGVLKDEYKEYFFQYLRGKKGQAVIARHHELLDLLPLDEAKTLYNYQLTDYDADDELFRTQTVNYTLFSKDVAAGRFIYTIAIPHPHHEDLASYDITLLAGDDAEKCELKAGQYTLEKQENNQKRILLVSCSSGEPMNIPAEGELQFVSNGQTATLAFDHLRDLICLNRPELYHASICERLRRECNDYQDFLDMFYFFREKSCLSMLLARFYVKIAEPSQKQIWDIGKIDYCAVTSKEAHMTRIFSPLKSKIQEMYVNGNFTTVDFRRGAVTTAYELENNTTYVLQEKNGSLWSSIDERIMTPDNLHLFGFIPGEVRCTNDGDKIVVPNLQFKVNNKEQPLFFDFDNSKLRIEEGTRVLFFPIVIVEKSDDTYKTNKIEIITDDTL